MNKDFDSGCFKCIEEMQKTNQGGAAASILAMKMQQGVANQDLDNIHLCSKHA
ncbi:hypothetical protein [Spiroplasma monobiae]|uniref:Uncharacterized protein n=1 Tax=Spiroplasma monobiae MQ-1 TaxID=1336748 RepID=A0A2K9LVK3_SPISQ|nr:hypothetical protein [Spiroplasma monobiae]AUM63050.1 hypothetical protein SMONO_v1c08010 [Spiroplasma monobiae MQ-1]